MVETFEPAAPYGRFVPHPFAYPTLERAEQTFTVMCGLSSLPVRIVDAKSGRQIRHR